MMSMWILFRFLLSFSPSDYLSNLTDTPLSKNEETEHVQADIIIKNGGKIIGRGEAQ